jgi:hypothetical protein
MLVAVLVISVGISRISVWRGMYVWSPVCSNAFGPWPVAVWLQVTTCTKCGLQFFGSPDKGLGLAGEGRAQFVEHFFSVHGTEIKLSDFKVEMRAAIGRVQKGGGDGGEPDMMVRAIVSSPAWPTHCARASNLWLAERAARGSDGTRRTTGWSRRGTRSTWSRGSTWCPTPAARRSWRGVHRASQLSTRPRAMRCSRGRPSVQTRRRRRAGGGRVATRPIAGRICSRRLAAGLTVAPAARGRAASEARCGQGTR